MNALMLKTYQHLNASAKDMKKRNSSNAALVKLGIIPKNIVAKKHHLVLRSRRYPYIS